MLMVDPVINSNSLEIDVSLTNLNGADMECLNGKKFVLFRSDLTALNTATGMHFGDIDMRGCHVDPWTAMANLSPDQIVQLLNAHDVFKLIDETYRKIDSPLQ